VVRYIVRLLLIGYFEHSPHLNFKLYLVLIDFGFDIYQ